MVTGGGSPGSIEPEIIEGIAARKTGSLGPPMDWDLLRVGGLLDDEAEEGLLALQGRERGRGCRGTGGAGGGLASMEASGQ